MIWKFQNSAKLSSSVLDTLPEIKELIYLFIVKSILKIIIHVLKCLQTNFEYFTSKTNVHGTFLNLLIQINYLAKLWNHTDKIWKIWNISYENIMRSLFCKIVIFTHRHTHTHTQREREREKERESERERERERSYRHLYLWGKRKSMLRENIICSSVI